MDLPPGFNGGANRAQMGSCADNTIFHTPRYVVIKSMYAGKVFYPGPASVFFCRILEPLYGSKTSLCAIYPGTWTSILLCHMQRAREPNMRAQR